MKNTSIFLSLIFLFSCGSGQLHKTAAKKNNTEIPGQSAPPDMVFIAGNGSNIPGFYASTAEEPNINYVIYLKWLASVYGESYPEVVEKALPKKPSINSSYKHNDPFLNAYMTHPAFAYYPVVNLTWEQVDNYLSWKTDRLNEVIISRTGISFWIGEQKDEDNFNTEAYLTGQYEGMVRKNLYDAYTGGERPAAIGDGILFTGFRLPTEEEWDYMAGEKFQKKENFKLKKRAPFHPYGKDYFTLPYGRMYGDRGAYSYGKETLPIGLYSYRVDAKYFADTNYDFGKETVEGAEEGIKSIYNFNPKEYGLINMKDGVQEWVVDEHQEGNSNKGLHWIEVMRKGGFNVDDAAEKDTLGQYVQKSYRGRMRNFRYIGMDANGNPNEIGFYKPDISPYYTSEEEKLALDTLVESNPRIRVIKGGTSENPSLESSQMKENEASSNVGFRTILPYTGQPVLKGYKVKWGKKQQIKY